MKFPLKLDCLSFFPDINVLNDKHFNNITTVIIMWDEENKKDIKLICTMKIYFE